MLSEMALSDNIIVRKRLADVQALLSIRKERKTGTLVSLNERHVFSTRGALNTAIAAKSQAGNKKGSKPRRRVDKSRKLNLEVEEAVSNGTIVDESDCMIVTSSKSGLIATDDNMVPRKARRIGKPLTTLGKFG